MPMCRSDAELFYDGRIPPGAVDDALPAQFSATVPHVVRVGRVVEKPAATMARMADAMLRLAIGGQVLEADVLRLGFTKDQFDRLGQDALRLMLLRNPTLTSIEMGA